jgi:P-type conjugative transfer ATPase TrbB
MQTQTSDSLRHLEKDFGDILLLLEDPNINEIILNPFKRKDGVIEGHILIEKNGGNIVNYTKKTKVSFPKLELYCGDTIIVKYAKNQQILYWIKFDDLVNENLLNNLESLILNEIDIYNNKIIQNHQPDNLNILESLLSSSQQLVQFNYSELVIFLNSLLINNPTYYLKAEVIDSYNKNKYIYPTIFEQEQIVKMTATKAETIMSILASITGNFIHNKIPYLECQIPKYGHRFTGIIPPITIFPAFCIRKHSIFNYSLDDFVTQGVMESTTCETIRSWIKRKFNILIAGGTGSGKTTLANGILAEINAQFPNERMLIIEDVPELQFDMTKSVSLTTNEFFSMYDALRTTLRFKPNRIIMGEVRGAEAYTLLKAWNTGHPGGVATIHANGVTEALYRFENCILDFNGARVNRKEIGFTINGIISIQNITVKKSLPNGDFVNQVKRKVTAIRQILDYDRDNDIYHDIIYDKMEQNFE